MSEKNRVAVLGLAERAAQIEDGDPRLTKWNILGLKNVIVSQIYPLSLDGWSLGIAFRFEAPTDGLELVLLDDAGNEAVTISVAYSPIAASDPQPTLRADGAAVRVTTMGWTTAFLPLGGANPFVIQRPGTYRVIHRIPASPDTVVGLLTFGVARPFPLTPERIAAIRADPDAVKAIAVELGCRHCASKLRVYAGLERLAPHEDKGYVWYEDVPDVFTCSCGKTTSQLDLIRSNLVGVLGSKTSEGTKALGHVRLYEASALEQLLVTFRKLLESNPREEVLQQFLEENPVLFHQFPAEQIFFKPAILNFFNADFAIVTPQRELVLIEIEKTSTRLLTKRGGEAAELTHAIDQVHSWLHVVDDHRLAVLDGLRVPREQVSAVRGVVIAGRDRGYDADHLRRLKGVDRGRIRFLTYDDIAYSLAALLRGVAAL